jgi:hypothetical protein
LAEQSRQREYIILAEQTRQSRSYWQNRAEQRNVYHICRIEQSKVEQNIEGQNLSAQITSKQSTAEQVE